MPRESTQKQAEIRRIKPTHVQLSSPFNMLAEVTTTAISQREQPEGFEENKRVAKRGGKVAGAARENVEKELGESVISPLNAGDKVLLETKKSK